MFILLKDPEGNTQMVKDSSIVGGVSFESGLEGFPPSVKSILYYTSSDSAPIRQILSSEPLNEIFTQIQFLKEWLPLASSKGGRMFILKSSFVSVEQVKSEAGVQLSKILWSDGMGNHQIDREFTVIETVDQINELLTSSNLPKMFMQPQENTNDTNNKRTSENTGRSRRSSTGKVN